ncbi:hypothetical protein DVH05_003197 [Phytophthora capsici]|nr:hypothetical protein DVH05_010150 [Phytophthora capsici]KAG1705508.1 hypothetical protein DVH05_003197 [Phytophthora capsici]
MKKVIETKDATTLPIIISAIFLTNTTVWTIFAIADDDVFVIVPNAIGMLVCIAQVVLYVMYPPHKARNACVNSTCSGDDIQTPKTCEDAQAAGYVSLKSTCVV